MMRFGWSHAHGIHTRDQAAHTCSSYDIDGDVMLLQPLDHSDVGKAARAAAAENQRDFWALSRWARRGFLCRNLRRQQRQQNTQYGGPADRRMV